MTDKFQRAIFRLMLLKLNNGERIITKSEIKNIKNSLNDDETDAFGDGFEIFDDETEDFDDETEDFDDETEDFDDETEDFIDLKNKINFSDPTIKTLSRKTLSRLTNDKIIESSDEKIYIIVDIEELRNYILNCQKLDERIPKKISLETIVDSKWKLCDERLLFEEKIKKNSFKKNSRLEEERPKVEPNSNIISEIDEVYKKVIEYSIELKIIYPTLIQNHFKISKEKTCEIIDWMKSNYFIIPKENSTKSKVIITKNDCKDMFENKDIENTNKNKSTIQIDKLLLYKITILKMQEIMFLNKSISKRGLIKKVKRLLVDLKKNQAGNEKEIEIYKNMLKKLEMMSDSEYKELKKFLGKFDD